MSREERSQQQESRDQLSPEPVKLASRPGKLSPASKSQLASTAVRLLRSLRLVLAREKSYNISQANTIRFKILLKHRHMKKDFIFNIFFLVSFRKYEIWRSKSNIIIKSDLSFSLHKTYNV